MKLSLLRRVYKTLEIYIVNSYRLNMYRFNKKFKGTQFVFIVQYKININIPLIYKSFLRTYFKIIFQYLARNNKM